MLHPVEHSVTREHREANGFICSKKAENYMKQKLEELQLSKLNIQGLFGVLHSFRIFCLHYMKDRRVPSTDQDYSYGSKDFGGAISYLGRKTHFSI